LSVHREVLRNKYRKAFPLEEYNIDDEGNFIKKEFPDSIKKAELDVVDALIIVGFKIKDKLKPMHWMMFCLKYYERMKNKDLAEIMGYSKGRPSQITIEIVRNEIREYIEKSSIYEFGDIYDGLQAIHRVTSRIN
jgi:predicted aldo/keto reductase-like oxidoreductase